MRVECFGASRPQQGRTANEDAFLIRHGERPFALLCDGAGNAQQAAKKGSPAPAAVLEDEPTTFDPRSTSLQQIEAG